MTMNVHNLLHLNDIVKYLGPLHMHSCFHFEDKNWYILKLFHGSQNMPFQIVSALGFLRSLPDLICNIPHNSAAQQVYKLTCKSYPLNEHHLYANIYLKGLIRNCNLTEDELTALDSHFKIALPDCSAQRLLRIRINNEIFHCKQYLRPDRRNSYTVQLKNAQFFMINSYIAKFVCFCYAPSECQCTHQYLALGIELKLKAATLVTDKITNCNGQHVSIVQSASKLSAVDIRNIDKKKLYILKKSDEEYVIQFPNASEGLEL